MAYANAVAHNIAAIRAARREGAALRAAKASVKQVAVRPIVVEKTFEQKYAVLNTLTVAQYICWLKKNVRQYGRRAEFGNGRQNAVEVFVKEVTGIAISFTASGEVEVSGEQCTLLSGWSDIAYYTYDDNDQGNEPVFVTTFGKALDLAMQAEAPFIVNWNFQG